MGPGSGPGSRQGHPAVQRVRQALRQAGSAAEVIELADTARTAVAAASALGVPPGAILIYLAEKTGKLLPSAPEERMDTLQWLMFQMGGVGPFFGQTHHFNRFAEEKIPYAIERYVNETKRLYGVMDRRLEKVAYLAGDYSIADVATFPWVARWPWHGLDNGLKDFPNVVRWYDAIRARPAVQRGYNVPASDQEIPAP